MRTLLATMIVALAVAACVPFVSNGVCAEYDCIFNYHTGE